MYYCQDHVEFEPNTPFLPRPVSPLSRCYITVLQCEYLINYLITTITFNNGVFYTA